MKSTSKVIVITGASDGIGAAAARLLAAQGHQVVCIGRSEHKTKAIATELHSAYYLADFSILSDVHALANYLKKDHPKIDILVNNAGGIFSDRQLTVDGHEITMQVNHLAHFLLTNLLLEVLLANKATVINTSSVANRLFSSLRVTDLDMAKGYSPLRAYGNAKLENILFTKELHRRFNHQGLSSAAFHPGNVATNFAHNTEGLFYAMYQSPLKHFMGLLTAEEGADTLVWLATTRPGIDWQSGEYYMRRQLAKAARQANDAELAKELWNQSERMVSHQLHTS